MRCLIVNNVSPHVNLFVERLVPTGIRIESVVVQTSADAERLIKIDINKFNLILIDRKILEQDFADDLRAFMADVGRSIPILVTAIITTATLPQIGNEFKVPHLCEGQQGIAGNACFQNTSSTQQKIALQQQQGLVLTRRQKQLANLLVRGYSNKEISNTLLISESTTKNYVFHLTRLLGVKTRAKLSAKLRDIGDFREADD